jgi:hypothetical protein
VCICTLDPVQRMRSPTHKRWEDDKSAESIPTHLMQRIVIVCNLSVLNSVGRMLGGWNCCNTGHSTNIISHTDKGC